MKTLHIPAADLHVSQLCYGCMGIGGDASQWEVSKEEKRAAYDAVYAALEYGITLFDHANIYAKGKSERVFGELLKDDPGLRNRIILQSKCGIRRAKDDTPTSPARYDFSFEHIVTSVEASLERLQTDYLDILLLHRPDILGEPEEVAAAFAHLYNQGKVRWFGVSNHTPQQIELLMDYVDHPIIVNQVEISLLRRALIEEGILFNQQTAGIAGVSGTLDYCQSVGIHVQGWSPLAKGALFELGKGAPNELIHLIRELAGAYETTAEAIVLGWLTRHPAGIQPVVGTTNPERIKASCEVSRISLSRDDWYRLLEAARGEAVP